MPRTVPRRPWTAARPPGPRGAPLSPRGAGRSFPGPPSPNHLAELPPMPLPGESGPLRPASWENPSALNQHAFNFIESFQQQKKTNPVVFSFSSYMKSIGILARLVQWRKPSQGRRKLTFKFCHYVGILAIKSNSSAEKTDINLACTLLYHQYALIKHDKNIHWEINP